MSAEVHTRRGRIVLAHDWLVGKRGGEAVLERIARLVLRRQPSRRTPVFTMFANGASIGDTVDSLDRITPELTTLPGANTVRRWMLPLYPLAVERLSAMLAKEHARDPIKLVISTSSAAIKGLTPPPGVAHVCYCHTPARYLWSQEEEYARESVLRRLGLRVFGNDLREWDRSTAGVTEFLANSHHTAAEIRRYYGREATVVHPPARTSVFTPGSAARERWLFAGALEPYKRADLAIGAAALTGESLDVVGEGTERRKLEQLQVPGVRFHGRVEDAELVRKMRAAKLLVFPQVEDFGITAVEALACGTPVVARSAGGALDFVREGETGAMFDEPTVEALAAAVARCPDPDDPRVARACRDAAMAFSEEEFDRKMEGVIRCYE